MDKYAELRTKGTNGINCGLETEDIIAQLQAWDAQYGIEFDEVDHDRLLVRFKTLPADLDSLVEQIYEFCPDVIDQGFGCIGEGIDHIKELGQEVPAWMATLVEGVDLEDEDYGLELLARTLRRKQELGLWWD